MTSLSTLALRGLERSDATVNRLRSPMILDLRPYHSLASGDLPVSLKRTLAKMNTDKQSDLRLGIFTSSIDDVKTCYAKMSHICTTLGDDRASRMNGLAAIEADNEEKIVPASGRSAYSYFMNDSYPWHVEDNPTSLSNEVVVGLASFFRNLVVSGRLDPGYSLAAALPWNYERYATPIQYKKGSSYGVFPYVPGRDRSNSLALIYHSLNAIQISRSWSAFFQGSGSAISERIGSVFSDTAGSRMYCQHPDAFMMISRARPLSASKPIPKWYLSESMTLKADYTHNGYCSGLRVIKPVCASLNLQFTGISQQWSTLFQQIDGLHVGHQIMSPHLLFNCFDSWGRSNTSLMTTDISRYDESVGMNILDDFTSFLECFYECSGMLKPYLDYIHSLPIMTYGFGEKRGTYSIFKRSAGISSGFQGTTTMGTMINLMAHIRCLTMAGFNIVDILSGCANFSSVTNTPLKNCWWGLLLKGDDVVCFWKGSKLSKNIFMDGFAELGFSIDEEPGPIFLMQFIDVTTRMRGSEYMACPDRLRQYGTFKSYGLAAKRIGNRQIFVEHPLNDIRPARLAIYSNLIDLQFHPLFADVSSYMLDLLDRADHERSTPWTLITLQSYLASDEGKKGMQQYAMDEGRQDTFFKELLRRRDLSYGAASAIDDASSALTVNKIVDDILSEVAPVLTPGLSEQQYKTITGSSLDSAGITESSDGITLRSGIISDTQSLNVRKSIINFVT